MKKKLISMGLCAMLLGTMCTSAFAGMDVSADLHNQNAEVTVENEELEITPRGFMCDCGKNMVRTEYYKSPWRLIKEVECRFGKPNCRDAKEYREITQTWTCGDCGRNFTTCTREDRQICLG